MTEHAVESPIEQQVLVSILSSRPDVVAGTRSLLASRVDWDALLGLGRKHNVVPLLFTWLRAHAQDLVPPDRYALLRSWYHDNAAQNIQLAHALIEIMDALGAAGITAMPVKGPVMALQAYSDLTLRQFCDLDLLIHPQDLARAHQALERIGYQSIHGLTSERVSLVGASLQPVVEVRREGCLVELHLGSIATVLADTVPSTHWWEVTETVELHGHRFTCLSRVNNMLLASTHGSKHQWSMLKWVADLSALLDGASAAEREMLLQYARAFGIQRLVSCAVELADALRHDPEFVQQSLAKAEHTRPTKLEIAIERLSGYPEFSNLLMNRRVFLKLRDRRRDSITGYLGFIFAPRPHDVAAVSLPPWLSSLYYPVRVARLLSRALLKTPLLFSRRSR